MGPSHVSFAMLYDYLRSLFHVWKLIPFEASLRGSALLHYLTSTPSILAPSQSVMFYCYVVFWMRLFNVAGRWGALQHKELKKKLESRSKLFFDDYWWSIFSFSGTTVTLSIHCRIGTAPDSKRCVAQSFEIASLYFLGWWGGEGRGGSSLEVTLHL